MSQFIYFLLFTVISSQTCPPSQTATTLDFSQPTQVPNKLLSQLQCNAQTRIDFKFNQAASGELLVNFVENNYYTIENHEVIMFEGGDGEESNANYLQFLNRDGKELSYLLKGMSINKYEMGKARVILHGMKTTPDYQLSLVYTTSNGNQDTIVSIYLLKSTSTVTIGDSSVITNGQTTNPQINGFYNLVKSYLNLSSSMKINNIAGGISYLNKPDLSQFYTTQISPAGCGKKINFLLSGFTIQLTQDVDFGNITTTPTHPFSYTSNQSVTGNRLCYGSHIEGVFQTHMRESYPLWAAWFSVLIFWCTILFGQSNTISVYDKDFKQNKWTSWEMYSLWYLANENFFSRIMRTTAVFASFQITCLTSSILYSYVRFQHTSPLTILYFGIGSMLASFIYSFFSGFFLSNISSWHLAKYTTKKKIQTLNNKQDIENTMLQFQIDKCEDRIYIYYYWFYVVNLIVIIACWVLAIHFMQRLGREEYYLMYYWVGSVGVGTVLYLFVLTPLWTWACGGYAIAQVRGYWYDYRVGEVEREVEGF